MSGICDDDRPGTGTPDAPAEEWWPEAYCDEVMPPPRVSPDAWVVQLADGYALAAPEARAWEPERLTDGETVLFTQRIDHGGATLDLFADGTWQVSRPMPAAAESVYAVQAESLAETVEGCVREILDIAGAAAAAGTYDLAYYTFTEAAPYRFDAATGTFSPAGALQ